MFQSKEITFPRLLLRNYCFFRCTDTIRLYTSLLIDMYIIFTVHLSQ